MKTKKPLTTLGIHRSYKNPSKKSIRKVMMNLDLAETDAFGTDNCTPPLPVIAFYRGIPARNG